MTKLGALLKSEREKRGLSLHEIGMSLKINPKILKAIEDGDQPNLPAKTFLRGFVKSYAHFLRLDTEQTLQLFQEEYSLARTSIDESQKNLTPGPSAAQPTQAPSSRFENQLKRPNDSALPVASNNRIYTIVIAIVLLTSIAFVAKMMDKYQKESRISKSDLPASEEVVESTPTSLPAGTGTLSSPANPAVPTSTTLQGGATTSAGGGVNVSTTITTTTLKPSMAVPSVPPTTAQTNTPTTTLKPAEMAKPSTSQTGAPVTTAIQKPATALTGNSATATQTPTPTPTPTATTQKPLAAPAIKPVTATTPPQTTVTTPLPVTTATGAPATTSSTLAASPTTTLKPPITEVIVEALNRVSIRFTLNSGQLWESLTLNPDQVHTFRSRTGVQLEISDGQAINVIVNGRDRGVPGTIGKPIKLVYP